MKGLNSSRPERLGSSLERLGCLNSSRPESLESSLERPGCLNSSRRGRFWGKFIKTGMP